MVDKTPIKIIALIVIPLLIAVAVRWVTWDGSGKSGKRSSNSENVDLLNLSNESDAKVIITWLLPPSLLEVSGIAWMDADHFACVQDEAGTVFIYNVRQNKIDQEVPFGGKGDYEGIAIVRQTIYVLRSDGTLFGIDNYSSKQRRVVKYKTHLGKKQDSESLAYDEKNNRLLVAVKAVDPNSHDYKGIYAFDLKTKKMAREPVYKIDLKDEIFADVNKGKAKHSISPSDMDINPLTGDIYILEGTHPKILIMGPKGDLRSLYKLKGSDFPQPEGLSFSPDGKMYISNEGTKAEGNILQVELVDK